MQAVRREGYIKNKVFTLETGEREYRPKEAWAGNMEVGLELR